MGSEEPLPPREEYRILHRILPIPLIYAEFSESSGEFTK